MRVRDIIDRPAFRRRRDTTGPAVRRQSTRYAFAPTGAPAWWANLFRGQIGHTPRHRHTSRRV